MLKLNNNKGFTAVEFVIIAFVVLAIGGIGYGVYQNRSSSPTSITNKPAQETSAKSTEGEKTYKFGTHTLYYKPIKDWTESVQAMEDKNSNGYIYGSVDFKSADYKLGGDDGGECGQLVTSGKVISIFIHYNKDYIETIDHYIENLSSATNEAVKGGLIQHVQPVDFAGKKGVQMTTSPGECYRSVHTETIVDGYSIYVSAIVDNSSKGYPYLNAPYDSAYLDLVKSIRIN